MERLTFDGNFCDIAQCAEHYPCKYHETGCSQKQVWERLKAYEDAEERGEIIRLPVKMGEILWMEYLKDKPVKCRVCLLTQKLDGTWKMRLNPLGTRYTLEMPVDQLGIRAFWTKEELEKARELDG